MGNKAISFPAKIKLYKSLVFSILLHGCENWTVTADLARRSKAFGNKCYRMMLGIYHTEIIKRTNMYGNMSLTILAGHQEFLLSTVKRRKLSWFCHVCRHDMLPNIMLQGTVDGSGRRRMPHKSWRDNIT